MNGTVLLVVLAALIASANTRLNAVIAGQAVSVPVLLLVAAILVLVLAAIVLYLARSVLRDGLRLRPRMVTL